MHQPCACCVEARDDPTAALPAAVRVLSAVERGTQRPPRRTCSSRLSASSLVVARRFRALTRWLVCCPAWGSCPGNHHRTGPTGHPHQHCGTILRLPSRGSSCAKEPACTAAPGTSNSGDIPQIGQAVGVALHLNRPQVAHLRKHFLGSGVVSPLRGQRGDHRGAGPGVAAGAASWSGY